MKRLMSAGFLFLIACGGSPSNKPNLTESQKDQVKERVAQLRTRAPVCTNGQQTKVTLSNPCDDGDFLIFAGLSCLGGEIGQCSYIAQSQDQSGRFWRSPLRVNNDPTNAFSRDMALGILAYAAKTKDAPTLERWVAYVREHDGKMCPVATDNRCDIFRGIRTLTKIVGNKIGANIDWGNLSVSSQDAYAAELYGTIQYGISGFPLHLGAVQLLILEEVGITSTYWIDVARNALNDRQPNNALFAHIARRDDLAIKLFLEQAPTGDSVEKDQWSFERVDSEQAWKSSMDWDYIFLGNLLLR